MRAVLRHVRDLNLLKNVVLLQMVAAYAAEKQYWLEIFADSENRPFLKHHRKIRDEAVKSGYNSRFGLQARMWKLALVDAAETYDKYWKSIFKEVKQRLARAPLSADEIHYGNWLMYGYAQFFQCLENKHVKPPFAHDGVRFLTAFACVEKWTN